MLAKPIAEIPSGTVFFGHPKSFLEPGLFSTGLGEGLYVKVMDGAVSVPSGSFWPDLSRFSVEGYEAAPIDALLLISEKRRSIAGMLDWARAQEAS